MAEMGKILSISSHNKAVNLISWEVGKVTNYLVLAMATNCSYTWL